ncbi:MAG: hypothetical protein ACE5I3_11045 [Phycisphaerae bacterium]
MSNRADHTRWSPNVWRPANELQEFCAPLRSRHGRCRAERHFSVRIDRVNPPQIEPPSGIEDDFPDLAGV